MTIELKPTDGRKSFYGKMRVETADGVAVLYSYGTPIMREVMGRFERLYASEPSATTLRHIKAFCKDVKCKKDFMDMEVLA